jgi:hypothetical protein
LLSNIREKRSTRNGGKDTTAHRRIVTSLSLPPNHTLPDEARLYSKLVKGLLSVNGTEKADGKPWISSTFASFYTKLVIYEDMKNFYKDTFRKFFPLSTATTISSAIIDITSYLQANTNPIGFFLGQQASSIRGDDGHCWGVMIWEENKVRYMLVRDSNGGDMAKVPEWARIMADKLGIAKITLMPATQEERSSNKMCVELAYMALADLLDGTFLPQGSHTGTKGFDVSSNRYEGQPKPKKRKHSKSEDTSSPPVLRKKLITEE